MKSPKDNYQKDAILESTHQTRRDLLIGQRGIGGLAKFIRSQEAKSAGTAISPASFDKSVHFRRRNG